MICGPFIVSETIFRTTERRNPRQNRAIAGGSNIVRGPVHILSVQFLVYLWHIEIRLEARFAPVFHGIEMGLGARYDSTYELTHLAKFDAIEWAATQAR